MIASRVTLIFLLASLGGLAASTVDASEVYRWVDENGVVHFSQTAPIKPEAEVDRLALQDTRPSDYDPDQDIYGVAEQAERMKALREDMETKRQESLERQREAAKQPIVQYRQPERYGYPVFWNAGPKPPLRPLPPIDGPGKPIQLPSPINPPGTLKPR